MLFLFRCRDGAGKIKKCIYGVGRVHPLGLRGGLEKEGRGERADGNGNAVSGEMRKGGRKGGGERGRERQSEAIRYMPRAVAAVAPAPRKKCKTSGAPLPVTSLIPILPPSPAFLPFLTSPSQRGPGRQSLDSLNVRGRLQSMSPPF